MACSRLSSDLIAAACEETACEETSRSGHRSRAWPGHSSVTLFVGCVIHTPFGVAEALGVESKREGFLNHASWRHNKNVWGVNLEVYTGTDLDNAGLSTRAGESIQVHFEGLGLADHYPDKIYLTIRSTCKLELRTGSARLLD